MSGFDVTTSFVTAIVDEWVRAGVRHAVVAPGSRNTPLALALARDHRVGLDVVLDERSAAFRALGIGIATGVPAIVCCTSGTAAANFLPAVVEANHARVPMLVCTADRPPELRGVGAPQTIDQTHLFGGNVRAFHDPGPPDAGVGHDARWRSFAARAFDACVGSPPGPVHCNLPLREPLVPTGDPLLGIPGRAGGARWAEATHAHRALDADTAAHIHAIAATERGVIVAGWGAHADPALVARAAEVTGWPVLADPLSGHRFGPHAVSTYDALLRVPAFARSCAPDVVLRLGAPPTSKVTNAWLEGAPRTVLVDPDGVWLDPQRIATDRIVAGADAVLAAIANGDPVAECSWAQTWQSAEARARAAIDAALAGGALCEARIARDIADALPDGSTFAVASSMPVRAFEWAMTPRSGLHVCANRGANGIDGFVSTVFGLAAARPDAPTVGLCGDLCFLHDTNGLLTGRAASPATIVVVDNGGGAIFGYLPQRDLPAPEFERLFTTPQDVDAVAVARAHGIAAERVADAADLGKRIAEGTTESRVIVVDVDAAAARAAHDQMWAAVAAAIGERSA